MKTNYLVKLPQHDFVLPSVYEYDSETDILDYEHFNTIKSLCYPLVDLWQTLVFSVGGVTYIMLVDEEGLLKEDTCTNLPATLLAKTGYPIVGDVFVCRARGEDLVYLTPKERDNLLQQVMPKTDIDKVAKLTLW